MTPPKPFSVLSSEKKSHRTKAELNLRKSGEESLLSGVKIKERPEVKNDPAAHKEFARVSGLLKMIKKNDDLYSGAVNRYAQMVSECLDFEKKRETAYKNIERLESDYEDEKIEPTDYYKIFSKMSTDLISYDRQVQAKRDMMLKIEKEMSMTLASALRSIPKKVEDKSEDDPMDALLRKRG